MQPVDLYESRYFQCSGSISLFVWLQRVGTSANLRALTDKASAAALSVNATGILAILVFAHPQAGYVTARSVQVNVPIARTFENEAIFADAERMRGRSVPIEAIATRKTVAPKRLAGRNEPCWCGSAVKFKKCHGL